MKGLLRPEDLLPLRKSRMNQRAVLPISLFIYTHQRRKIHFPQFGCKIQHSVPSLPKLCIKSCKNNEYKL